MTRQRYVVRGVETRLVDVEYLVTAESPEEAVEFAKEGLYDEMDLPGDDAETVAITASVDDVTLWSDEYADD